MREHLLPRLAATIGLLGLSQAADAAPRPNPVIEWNILADDVIAQTPWQAGRSPHALAMVQAAVFDALDAIHPRYLPYLSGARAPAGASDVAAIAEAAWRVLRAVAPDQSDRVDAARDVAMATLDPRARTLGMAIGDQAAAAVIAARRRGGAFWAVTNEVGVMGPSAAEPTDDMPMPLLNIDRGPLFVLADVDQFLPPPPPPLDSPQSVRDLAETLRLGGADSVIRTPEQNRIADFHVLAGVAPRDAIARQAASTRGLDMLDTARLLALLDMAMADALSAGTSAKEAYHYARPDKRAAAIGQTSWRPAIGMPGTPEYPCQHCANGSTGQAVLEAVLGDAPIDFSITSLSSHETRRFRSFRQYAEEEAISRIYGGVHYRFSEIVGSALGRQVGEYVVATTLRPLATAGRAEATPN